MNVIEAWILVNMFGLLALIAIQCTYDHFNSKSNLFNVE